MKKIFNCLGAATTAFIAGVTAVWIYQNCLPVSIDQLISRDNIRLEKLVDVAPGTIESTLVDEVRLPAYLESFKRYKYIVSREFRGKGLTGTTIYQRVDGKFVGVELIEYSSVTQARQALEKALKKATIIKRKITSKQIFTERVIYLDPINDNGIQHAHISYLDDNFIRTIHAGSLELVLDFEQEKNIQPNGSG